MANTSKRGFASMEGEKQRVIASKGGRAAHAKGTAHEWSSDEARAAGRKGGESRGARGRSDLAETTSRMHDYASTEHDLTSAFLTNAGRSLRAPGTYAAPNGYATSNGYAGPGTNGQPAVSNTGGKLDSNDAAAYSPRNAPGIHSGSVRTEPQTA